jgi:hypothetical protein
MKKLYITLYVLFCVQFLNAQVGINTLTPSADLEVVGNALIEGSLFLENPGTNLVIRGSKLLVLTTANSVKQYDIDISKYGPINYAQFEFNNLSKDGLQDYDTKISTLEYIVSIQGYYFLEAGTGDTNIMAHSLIDNENIEGYQIYAYPNTTTNTWYLRAFLNDSEFMTPGNGNGPMVTSSVDMYLNIIIYRKGFIAKEQNSITVDMLNSETNTVALPTGF